MRKVMLGLVHGLICLMLIISCGFEMPQSITIKAEPGLRVPLGSPFKELGEGERLEDLISRDNIRKMMGEAADEYSAAGKIEIYDYQMGPNEAVTLGIDPDSQVYAVRYPIAEMQLDLNKYVQDVIADMDTESREYEVPSAIEGIPLETLFDNDPNLAIYLTDDGPNFDGIDVTPLFSIPLPEMYRLVTEVTGNKFGLRISRIEDCEDNVEVRIPALGIDDYIKGVPFNDSDGQWLEFVVDDNPTIFKPQEALKPTAGKLDIFIRLTGPYPGDITLDMVFEWEEAILDTSGVTGALLEGTYPIDNNLGDFLGSDVEFKIIDGYIYTSGGNDAFDATMSLTYDGDNLISSDPTLELVDELPQFTETTIIGPLPKSSLKDVIKLAPYVTAKNPDSPDLPELNYEIKITNWLLRKEDLETDDEKITIDLVILLPLEFKVFGASSKSEYVTLDLEGVFPEIKEDLLLRGEPGEDNDSLFKMLADVSILLSSIKSSILEHKRFAIRVSDENKYDEVLKLREGNPSVTFDNNAIANPFTPQFEFLIEKDEGENFATLRILRSDNPEFDFFITVTANVFIDETINL